MKGYFFCFILSFSTFVNANDWQEMLAPYFKNKAQKGLQQFQQEHYQKAADLFDDPYQKGVALYKAKHYAAAIKAFSKAQRPEIQASAAYNLGNSYIQLQQYRLAADAYQFALKLDPSNKKATYNLAISVAMLAELDPQQAQKKKDKKADEKKPAEKEQKKGDKESDEGGQGEDESEQNAESGDQLDPLEKTKKPLSEDKDKGDFNLNPDNEGALKNPFQPLEQTETEIKISINQQKSAKMNKRLNQWLDQIEGNPVLLLQNIFHIEEQQLKKNGLNHEVRPW